LAAAAAGVALLALLVLPSVAVLLLGELTCAVAVVMFANACTAALLLVQVDQQQLRSGSVLSLSDMLQSEPIVKNST
jgi:hypothetical protein